MLLVTTKQVASNSALLPSDAIFANMAAFDSVCSAVTSALQQLKDEPTNVIQWYQTADPLASALLICSGFMLYAWVGSVINGDYSYVR